MTSTTPYPRFELITGDKKARLELLNEHGGIINALVFSNEQGVQHNVIAGFESLEAIEQDRYYRGVPLYPFVNRLDAGRYSFNGHHYEFPVNETGRNNALHGFIQHLPVTITATHLNQNRAQAIAVYEYTGDRAGYPFPARVTMTYTLDSSGSLELEIAVLNLSGETVPVGIGWHPYFTLGEPVNDLLLRLPACQQVLVDDRLLPTGDLEPVTSFVSLTPIKNTFFDTCYALNRDDDSFAVKEVVLWSERLQQGLAIWQTSGPEQFNFIQVCVPPDRNSIAVEPVSCGINAFNTHEGLSYLQPGLTLAATCGVRWLQSL
jgi:aldose 1-epimerase